MNWKTIQGVLPGLRVKIEGNMMSGDKVDASVQGTSESDEDLRGGD